MKTTKSQRDKINLIFSSFLIIGYIVCAYFFSSLATTLSGVKGYAVQIAIMFVFGLLLFYATRVGEGKQIRRFSIAVLVLVDIPALYIILAALIPNLPLHSVINPAVQQTQEAVAAQAADSNNISIILMLAAVALGYGLPYTFFSGYEMKDENDVDEISAEVSAIEGGLKEELAEIEDEAKVEDTAEADDQKAEEASEAVEDTEENVTVTADEAEEAVTEIADAAEDSADTTEEKED